MAIISPNTFDPLKRYVGVRLQQGVPIVDADWNELEDVRRFELRAFLKWFVGDGVPHGNDGFRIDGTGLTNDFIIRAGAVPAGPGTSHTEIGLANVGRCLVDGLDIIIQEDSKFTDQPLHMDKPGSPELAAALGVPRIEPLDTPLADHLFTAYLDIWERIVSPTEDPDLVYPGLGTESCARAKREWVVRVREGEDLPENGDPDYLPGHHYYTLARIQRRTGIDPVDAEDVSDLREKRLLMPPATLVSDLFGVNTDEYRRGTGRPNISLRSAINALLRGELPMTPETAVTSDPSEETPSSSLVFDSNSHLWIFWLRDKDIWGRRLREGEWDPEVRLTTDAGVQDREPMAVMDNTGDIWTFWQRRVSSTDRQIWYRRYRKSTRNWDSEVQVPTGTGRAREPQGVVDSSGDLWLFYRFGSEIRSHKYNMSSNTWDASEQRTSGGTSLNPFSLLDSAGGIWLFYEGTRAGVTGRKIYSQVYSSGTWSAEEARSELVTSDNDFTPMAVEDNENSIRLFWSNVESGTGNHRAQAVTYDHGSSTWSPIENIYSSASASDLEPFAMIDTEGVLWLFLVNYLNLSSSVLLVKRMLPGSGTWGGQINLTSAGNLNRFPLAIQDDRGSINLFWQGERGGVRNLYTRKIIPTI